MQGNVIQPLNPALLLDRITETEQRFRIMADCAPVLLWMSEPDGLCSFFNQTWLDFTGRSLEQELGNGWAEGVHPEDFQRCMHIYLSAFVERQHFRMEYRLRRADGQYRWLLDQGVPRVGAGGNFAGFIGSCIDITEIKNTESQLRAANKELRVRTEELQRSNAELEQYAYVASHDLQEPLRMVAIYVGLLEKKYKEQLDEKAQNYMRYAVDGAKRMQRLVSDLLSHARASADPKSSMVDCNRILEGALQNLEGTVAETQASVNYDVLPSVRGDRTHLTQILQNLLDNALKFRRTEAPRIAVRVESQPTEWVFSVEDNGIGIEQQYTHRIFRLFQRLHTNSEYPGTGMGLALCKKLVESQGGRIWVQSQYGRGTTFYFTVRK